MTLADLTRDILSGIVLFPLFALPGILLALRWFHLKANILLLFGMACALQVAENVLSAVVPPLWPASQLGGFLDLALGLLLEVGALALAVHIGASAGLSRSLAAGAAGYVSGLLLVFGIGVIL